MATISWIKDLNAKNFWKCLSFCFYFLFYLTKWIEIIQMAIFGQIQYANETEIYSYGMFPDKIARQTVKVFNVYTLQKVVQNIFCAICVTLVEVIIDGIWFCLRKCVIFNFIKLCKCIYTKVKYFYNSNLCFECLIWEYQIIFKTKMLITF